MIEVFLMVLGGDISGRETSKEVVVRIQARGNESLS